MKMQRKNFIASSVAVAAATFLPLPSFALSLKEFIQGTEYGNVILSRVLKEDYIGPQWCLDGFMKTTWQDDILARYEKDAEYPAHYIGPKFTHNTVISGEDFLIPELKLKGNSVQDLYLYETQMALKLAHESCINDDSIDSHIAKDEYCLSSKHYKKGFCNHYIKSRYVRDAENDEPTILPYLYAGMTKIESHHLNVAFVFYGKNLQKKMEALLHMPNSCHGLKIDEKEKTQSSYYFASMWETKLFRSPLEGEKYDNALLVLGPPSFVGVTPIRTKMIQKKNGVEQIKGIAIVYPPGIAVVQVES